MRCSCTSSYFMSDSRYDSPERVATLERIFPDLSADKPRLRRFLRAREGNIQAAAEMLRADIAWRERTAIPPPLVTFTDRLRKGKAYFHRKNKEGMPVAIITPSRHTNSEPVDENIALSLFMLEM